MDGAPPPPPPPHGANPENTAGASANEGRYRRSTDLPDGPYDIFIIPPHSSGSGFLYLPSLQCHRNSFLAGVAATLAAIALYINVLPILKIWFASVAASGGVGVFSLVIGVAVIGWAIGKTQSEARSGSSRTAPPGAGDIPRSPRGGSPPQGGGGPGAAGPNDHSGGGQRYQNFGGQQYPGGGFRGTQNAGGQYHGGGGQYPSGHQYYTGNAPPPPRPEPGAQYGPGTEQETKSAPKPKPAGDTSEDEKAEAQRKEAAARKKREEEAQKKAEEEERRKKEEARRRKEEEEARRRREEEVKRREEEARRRREEDEARRRREEDEARRRREEDEARKRREEEDARKRHEEEVRKKREEEERKKAEEVEKIQAEARRKEEIRKKMEEFRRKKKEEEQKQKEQREKEARAKEYQEWKEKRAREKAEKEAAEKAAAEKVAQEKARQEAAARYAAARDAAAMRKTAAASQAGSTEKKNTGAATAATAETKIPTPQKKPPPPPATAKTVAEDDAYSFRPYDRPRSWVNKPNPAPSVLSDSSYTPSQSTARTTPPPSHHGPYTTKDPEKVIIHGVYSFNNTFMKTPIAQLVSGQGNVTDGLILRITTEGMFVDDDLRGVPQREWDIKAWTMKLVEVWCPLYSATASPRPSPAKPKPFRFGTSHSSSKLPTSEESDANLVDLLKVCKNQCRLGAGIPGSRNQSIDGRDINLQTATSRGYHVVRASLRDQEGKKYIFVLQATEGWKVGMGLQRLRKGSQVRALGVCGLPANETAAILTGLGY